MSLPNNPPDVKQINKAIRLSIPVDPVDARLVPSGYLLEYRSENVTTLWVWAGLIKDSIERVEKMSSWKKLNQSCWQATYLSEKTKTLWEYTIGIVTSIDGNHRMFLQSAFVGEAR